MRGTESYSLLAVTPRPVCGGLNTQTSGNTTLSNLFSAYKSNSQTSQTNRESTPPPTKRYKANESTPNFVSRDA